MSFDLTIAFDKAKYLDTQFELLITSMIDKVPEDTVIHVVTNRKKEDKIIKKLNQEFNIKYYYKKKDNNLKSRCRYMLNCFEIESDKDWIIKLESDFVILKHLNELNKILDDDYDLILEPENRYLFGNKMMKKIYRFMYRAMDIKCPVDIFIQYRENKKKGIPLFGTGMICVKNELLPTINKRWKELTKKCEPWIDFNTHPNEMAFTGMIFDEGWKWKLYNDIYKFNPIGHFRKGEFPSTKLIKDCKLPKDIVIFDYHRFPWLFHVAQYNPNLYEIIKNSNGVIKEAKRYGIREFNE
jgi:hypothetical protein